MAEAPGPGRRNRRGGADIRNGISGSKGSRGVKGGKSANRRDGRNTVAAFVEPVREFLREEATGALLLFLAAIAALVWANSPAADSYTELWSRVLTIGPVSMDLGHWVNDALMVIFFFVVGLEIKRELVNGDLRNVRTASLPVVAALGGVIAPALIFLAIASGEQVNRGWGIPIATDIAFAVGVLALLRNRISGGTRLFLLSLAIVDDVIAICVIAIFYTSSLDLVWLAAAGVGMVPVLLLRRLGVAAIWPYLLIGIGVWYATYESGVHATIAGVALGLLTPARPVRGRKVLARLEHRLHPISAFVVIPIFALANAGVSFGGGRLGDAVHSQITWGVAVGLLVGKTVGISVATLLALWTRIGWLPNGMNRWQIPGVAAVAGIGFTVSLFIAELSYQDAIRGDDAKVGILVGSLASGVLGVMLLIRSRSAGP